MKNIKSIVRTDVKTKAKEYLIYLRYTYNRRYVLFSTDLRVLLKNWNAQSGRVRKSTNFEKLNIILEKNENDLQKLILDIKIQNLEPTLLNVKNEYYKKFIQYQQDNSKPKKVDERKFLNDFQELIDDREHKKQVGTDTIKTYKSTLNKLIEFKKKKNYSLHYETINEDFYYEFINFLRYDEGLLDNSIDKYIKNVKLFMNYSFEKKRHSNMIFTTFKRTRTKTGFVVLNRKELIDLAYNYKPEPGSLKDKVRDTFLFGCSTGLRFGDLSKLTRGNFVIQRDTTDKKIIDNASETYISLNIGKTKQYLKLPVNNFIFDLIKKYNIENKEITFLKINNQVFNRVIKEVCKDVGIIEMIKISKRKGKENKDFQEPKYKFISSHTMRRTFITQMSNSTEITNVQAVSGHKDIKILTDYIKRNDRELNNVKVNLNDIFYKKDETLVGDKNSGINTRIVIKQL